MRANGSLSRGPLVLCCSLSRAVHTAEFRDGRRLVPVARLARDILKRGAACGATIVNGDVRRRCAGHASLVPERQALEVILRDVAGRPSHSAASVQPAPRHSTELIVPMTTSLAGGDGTPSDPVRQPDNGLPDRWPFRDPASGRGRAPRGSRWRRTRCGAAGGTGRHHSIRHRCHRAAPVSLAAVRSRLDGGPDHTIGVPRSGHAVNTSADHVRVAPPRWMQPRLRKTVNQRRSFTSRYPHWRANVTRPL